MSSMMSYLKINDDLTKSLISFLLINFAKIRHLQENQLSDHQKIKKPQYTENVITETIYSNNGNPEQSLFHMFLVSFILFLRRYFSNV